MEALYSDANPLECGKQGLQFDATENFPLPPQHDGYSICQTRLRPRMKRLRISPPLTCIASRL